MRSSVSPAHSDLGRLRARLTQPWWHVVLGLLVVFAVSTRYLGWIGLVVGVLPSIVLAYAMTRSVYVYERGVESGSVFGKKRLRYVDVASFSYSLQAGRSGLQTNMRLVDDRRQVVDIKMASLSSATDANLETLRQHLSELVAERYLAAIAAGRAVSWGDSLTISSKGICHADGRVLVPVVRGVSYGLAAGRCIVFGPNEVKARLALQCSEFNFYPGYVALASLYGRAGVPLSQREDAV